MGNGMSKAAKKEYADEAVSELGKLLEPGQTIYTAVVNASSSGMSRHIKTYIAAKDYNGIDAIRDITRLVANAIGYKISDKSGGMIVSGCGMDMGFHVIYSLGRAMYPGGVPCTGQEGLRCLSNDHTNGDRDCTKGKIHHDGGYAFNKSWL
jgi:hypothetical protein